MNIFKRGLSLTLSAAVLTACTMGTSKIEEKNNTDKNPTIAATDVPIADPFILFHDDTYYAYGTSSDDGFEVYYSNDLHNWKKHDEMALKKADSYGDKWFWAPETYFNPSNGKFYLFYSAEEHICVATSHSPLGPFKQEVKEPMRGEKGIDSSLFIDEDGTPYIYFVRFTNGNVIWVAELEDDWLTIKEETLTQCIEASQPWETVLGKVVEGASVIKQNGVYFMLYSGNDFRSPNYGVGVATATSPKGPWKKYDDNPVLQKPEENLVGTGHGAYFADRENQYKYVFHAHNDTAKVHPRLLYIVDMTIADNIITLDKNTIVHPHTIE